MLAHSCVPVLAVTIWFHLCGLCCTSYIGPCFYLWNSQINFGKIKKKKEMETLMMMTMLYPITIWITCALLLLLYFLLAHLLKLPCLCFIPYAEAFVADSVTAKVFAFVSRCALGRMCMCFCVVIERTRRTTA